MSLGSNFFFHCRKEFAKTVQKLLFTLSHKNQTKNNKTHTDLLLTVQNHR